MRRLFVWLVLFAFLPAFCYADQVNIPQKQRVYNNYKPGRCLTNDLAPIYAAIETGWGCVVGVSEGKHAILVVDIKKGTDKEGGFVEILDPSDSTLSVQQIPKSEFLRIWSGQIVTVWRKE